MFGMEKTGPTNVDVYQRCFWQPSWIGLPIKQSGHIWAVSKRSICVMIYLLKVNLYAIKGFADIIFKGVGKSVREKKICYE